MDEFNQEYLSVRTAVVVPSLQSLVSAAFYGGATAGVVAVANSLELLTVSPLAVGAVVGCLAGLTAWRSLLAEWRLALYGVQVEEHEPVTVQDPVSIQLTSDGGRVGQYADLPVSQDKLAQLAAGVTSGDSLSVSRWCGRGGPFSRSEFEQLRGELLQLQWLEWKSDRDNARGVQLTRSGAAVMRYFASQTTSPQIR